MAKFDEDDMKFLSTSMLHAEQRAMYCGMGTGQLAVSDLRARAKPVLYQLHDKTIRAVDVSPGDPNLLLTGSIDTTVALWDARKLKGKVDTPRPSPRTNCTRRVPHPVLIGHTASLTPY